MSFYYFFTYIIVARLVELLIAKRNERWIRNQGAIEFGNGHYSYIVGLHALFLLSFLFETIWRGRTLSPLWPLLLSVFIAVQVLRVWTIRTLGCYWNTKIFVVPNAQVVTHGPYRWLRHPNYVVVALEFLLIPLLYQAYWTTIIFTILNGVILSIRITIEERALKSMTNYQLEFQHHARFVPLRPVKD